MTESKKKTTKKEVVEQNEGDVKQPKKVKAKPEKKVKDTELVDTQDEVTEEIAEVTEKATAADYGMESEARKEKKDQKSTG